jgi:CheY-like chemotaxis protein
MPSTRRLLVADSAESLDVLRGALASTCTFERVSTVEQAKIALADPPDVVICGCHFDEGRMYDLLRHLKATPGLKNVPFVAVRCVEGELLDDALYESVKIAVRALGGNAFVDLLRWQRRWGHAEASHRLTNLIDTLAAAPPSDTGG